jgi:hypothetical protein
LIPKEDRQTQKVNATVEERKVEENILKLIYAAPTTIHKSSKRFNTVGGIWSTTAFSKHI